MYVGSTIFTLRKSIVEHQRAIKKADFTYPVACHFFEQHESDVSQLTFFAVDRIPANLRGGNRVVELRCLESKYILDLHTKTPAGRNKDEEMEVHVG